MPPIRRYIVTQERRVLVSASTAIEAANLAERVFSGTIVHGDRSNININSEIIEGDLTIREES